MLMVRARAEAVGTVRAKKLTPQHEAVAFRGHRRGFGNGRSPEMDITGSRTVPGQGILGPAGNTTVLALNGVIPEGIRQQPVCRRGTARQPDLLACDGIQLEIIQVTVIVRAAGHPHTVLDAGISCIDVIAEIIELDGAGHDTVRTHELQCLDIGQDVNALVTAVNGILTLRHRVGEPKLPFRVVGPGKRIQGAFDAIRVVPGTAVDGVIAETALQGVVAAAASQRVMPGGTADAVGLCSTGIIVLVGLGRHDRPPRHVSAKLIFIGKQKSQFEHLIIYAFSNKASMVVRNQALSDISYGLTIARMPCAQCQRRDILGNQRKAVPGRSRTMRSPVLHKTKI